jgi:SNF2 family DNA or RNA helicase
MCALWVDMGLGKTISTLTAFVDLLVSRKIKKVLVIAPLRVAQHTWPQEINNWSHLKALRFSVLAGLSAKQREEAMHSSAQIHIINRENVQWLVNALQRGWHYDAVVIDESSSFKSHSSQRWKALRQVVKTGKIKRLVQLTGTPSPNSLMDLWPQIYLLDQGKRLGDTRGRFVDAFCKQVGNPQWSQYEVRADMKEVLQRRVADLVLRMAAKDYLELPDRIDSNVVVQLPPKAKKAYDQMEKDFLIEIDDGEVLAANAAVKINKLLQVSSGSIYTEDGYSVLHDAKIEALKEIVEASNEPVLVAYNFKSDAERICKAIKGAKVLGKDTQLIDKWNQGGVPLMLAHPASAGHGLNLQHGGSLIVWFGLSWSLELYQQFNARLHRQGQKKPVRVIHLLANTGADWTVKNVLENKETDQNVLFTVVNAFRNRQQTVDRSYNNYDTV